MWGFLIDGDHAIKWYEGAIMALLEQSVGSVALSLDHILVYAYHRAHCPLHLVVSSLPG